MTPKQEEALRDYLQEVIVPLIEEVLVKKLGQALTFAKEELAEKPAQRTWVDLTFEELSEVYNQADWDTVDSWGYERAIEAKLKEKNT